MAIRDLMRLLLRMEIMLLFTGYIWSLYPSLYING
jgi:hypothetical protein